MPKTATKQVIKIHPAAAVVDAFGEMRDSCEHYHGILESLEEVQCSHKDHKGREVTQWCAMDVCPLLQEHARAASLGWDF